MENRDRVLIFCISAIICGLLMQMYLMLLNELGGVQITPGREDAVWLIVLLGIIGTTWLGLVSPLIEHRRKQKAKE